MALGFFNLSGNFVLETMPGAQTGSRKDFAKMRDSEGAAVSLFGSNPPLSFATTARTEWRGQEKSKHVAAAESNFQNHFLEL